MNTLFTALFEALVLMNELSKFNAKCFSPIVPLLT